MRYPFNPARDVIIYRKLKEGKTEISGWWEFEKF